jgi:hypothetical protein
MINHTIQPENVKRFVNLNQPDGVKEIYFVLIIDIEKPPWILTRYRKGYPPQVFSILLKDTAQ